MNQRQSFVWMGGVAGLFAGLVAGGMESLVVLSQSSTGEYRALVVGSVLYSVMGVPLGIGIGLLSQVIQKLKWTQISPSRLWSVIFLVVGATLGQGVLHAMRPILWPISPLVEAWWNAWVVLIHVSVGGAILWLVPIFVERTPLRRVFEWGGVLKIYGTVLLFAILFSSAPGEPRSAGDIAPDRPKVLAPEGSHDFVLILVDGLRADHLGSYGDTSGLTPSLDQFAEESVQYREVVSPSPTTAPAIASVMTGMIPTAHGCTTSGCRMSDGLTTLSEVLREHGYATSMLANHEDLYQLSGFDQGFDYFAESLRDPVISEGWSAEQLLWVKRFRQFWDRYRNGPRAVNEYYRSADLVLNELREVVTSNRDRGNRFFAIAHLMETHSPLFEWDGEATTGESLGPVWSGDGKDLNVELLRAIYADEVHAVDREIGRFLDWLDQEPGFEETVVVVAGLQGQSLGEHDRFWEGASVYEEAVRVPLLIRLPNQRLADTHATWRVRLIDLAPTLGVLAGATNPSGWQGEDLLDGRSVDGLLGDLEDSEVSLNRDAVTELDLPDRRLQSLRSEQWAFIRSCGPESTLDHGRSGCPPLEGGDVEELYHLTLDENEEQNLSGQEGQLQSSLSVTLRTRLETAEEVAADRAQLMDAISGCPDCQAMEAEGRILDCSAFCGTD